MVDPSGESFQPRPVDFSRVAEANVIEVRNVSKAYTSKGKT
jgi:hypothetical protein